jgi:hypothetical protein
MKRLPCLRLVVLLALLFAHHSASAQSVKSDYAKNYNFGVLKRFKWQENQLLTARNAEDNKLLDRKIMRTVTQALAAKGIVEDASSPDFYLFYHAGIGDESSQVGSSPTAGGIVGPQAANSLPPATWGGVAGSSAGFAPSVWYSLEGQVSFYVVDSKSKSVVWQCRATKKWNDVPKARKNEDQEIKQIVEKSFKQFPPKDQN